MSKQKAATPAPAKSSTKTINRTRRNAATRKCLPKQYKILFAGSSRSEFRSILAAWQDGRKKVKES